MVERFFHSNIGKVNYLIRNNRTNCEVLALIITEMYFNSLIKRIIEYTAFLLLSKLFPYRIDRLSVGIAQVQIRHWRDYGFISKRIKVFDILIISDTLKNYDIAYELIKPRLIEKSDFSKILADYRGESRAYHLKIYTQFYGFIKNYCG
jgi:hypothetical protein